MGFRISAALLGSRKALARNNIEDLIDLDPSFRWTRSTSAGHARMVRGAPGGTGHP
jgi:hypothetical protein